MTQNTVNLGVLNCIWHSTSHCLTRSPSKLGKISIWQVLHPLRRNHDVRFRDQKPPAVHPPAKTMHFIAEKQIPFRPCSKSSVFVGRQPIYGKDDSSFGYELLFRSSFTNEANIEDGQKATAELLINTFAEIGLERIVGSLPAFINVSEEFIVNQHCHFLPKDKVVIEVLENVKPTREVMLALSDLKREGYTVALDDFVYSECLKPMLELADIVKIDVSVFENAADLKKQIVLFFQLKID